MTLPSPTPEQLEARRQWVAALRSGNFTQGRGSLVEEGTGAVREKFCCLGVACEVSKKGHWEDPPAHNVGRAPNYVTPQDPPMSGALPGGVRNWLGLTQGDPQIDYGEDGLIEICQLGIEGNSGKN